jgi:small-conductance mechanosensitive channel
MRMVTILLYIVIIVMLIYLRPIVVNEPTIPIEWKVTADKLFATVEIIFIVVVLLRIAEEWVRSHFKLSEDESRYISSVLNYVGAGLILFFLGLVYISDITSLTIFSGLIGAGLALALQPTTLNVIGWVSIVLSRLYKTGDRVFIGDNMWGVLGDVSDISLFFTRINELDRVSWQETGGFVSVPNRLVLEKSVVNYTAESPFIWDEISVRIAYGSDYELAKKLAEEAVNKIMGEKMRDAAKFLSLRKYKLKIRDIKEEPIAYVSLEGGAIRVAVRYLVSARKKRQAQAQITERLLKSFWKSKNKVKVVG